MVSNDCENALKVKMDALGRIFSNHDPPKQLSAHCAYNQYTQYACLNTSDPEGPSEVVSWTFTWTSNGGVVSSQPSELFQINEDQTISIKDRKDLGFLGTGTQG